MDSEPFQSQPPIPPKPRPDVEQSAGRIALSPTPVVRVLSPMGVEYVFLVILLLSAAAAFSGSLMLMINGQMNLDALSFPAAALLVTVPAFALLFLRLKKMELRRPELRFDPSKRRSTQFVQIFMFVVTLLTLVGFFFAIFTKLAGNAPSMSIGKAILNTLSVLVVSGGILTYYWHDEHKLR